MSGYKKTFSKGLCDCFEVCCTPLCCMSFFCPGIVWGQILTRLKLNALGLPSTTSYKYTFSIFVACWVVYLVTHQIQAETNKCEQTKKLEGYDDTATIMEECDILVGLVASGISFSSVAFMLCGLVSARIYLRRKLQIKPGCIGSDEGCMDDCLVSWFCTCCATIQMVRETQEGHPYECCNCCVSATGLPPGVEFNLTGTPPSSNMEMERFTDESNNTSNNNGSDIV